MKNKILKASTKIIPAIVAVSIISISISGCIIATPRPIHPARAVITNNSVNATPPPPPPRSYKNSQYDHRGNANSPDVDIYIDIDPPAPRYEAIPNPRRGWVWVPGHWEWVARYRNFDWVPGHWEKELRGRHYIPGRWERSRGGWRWVPGYWN